MLADALQKGEKEEPGVHYRVDEKQKSVLMTDEGYEECEEALGVSTALLHHCLGIFNILRTTLLQ